MKSFCGGSRGAVFSKRATLVAEGKERRQHYYQPGYLVPWEVDYCIDAMLEHAFMHPMRHRFQLLELLES